MTANNEIIILDSILEQKRRQTDNSLPDDVYFELFTFEQALKKYDPSNEELLSGQIGGGDDGGIDGLFTFINEEILSDDTEIELFKGNPLTELFLIQSKRSPSFSETAFNRVIATAMDIFNLSKNIAALKKNYNTDLIDKINTFRQAYLKLASKHPILKINYVYASKGDTASINQKVYNRADTLRETICQSFPGATACVKFIGARELIDASYQEKSYTLQLRFLENYISRGEDNYVVLASLKDYYKFVTDGNDELRKYIFASNVRDYQGNNVEVNKDIKDTLDRLDSNLDFWWLNNGITILSSKASIAGKNINLDEVQIVNGLQTTNTIYNYLKPAGDSVERQDNRAILIKIVVTNDAETRDRVIKATNFQTSIPVASLKATERIQSDIENYFLSKEWFYDRRKNYYKNMRKPSNKIVSILYLAQAVMALVFKEPDISRARPSSVIKKDSDYKRVFNPSFKLNMYLFCAKTMKQVDSCMGTTLSNQSKLKKDNQWFQTTTLRYLSFHLGMVLVVKLLNKRDYKPKDVESLLEVDIQGDVLSQTLSEVIELADAYARDRPALSVSAISKQKDFVTFLLRNVKLSLTETESF